LHAALLSGSRHAVAIGLNGGASELVTGRLAIAGATGLGGPAARAGSGFEGARRRARDFGWQRTAITRPRIGGGCG
jgi:hypothetical protein